MGEAVSKPSALLKIFGRLSDTCDRSWYSRRAKDLPLNAGDEYFGSNALDHLFFVCMLQYLNGDDSIVNLVERGLTKGHCLAQMPRVQLVGLWLPG